MSDSRYADIGSPETKAIEECAELIYILCKADRFGWNCYHPADPTQKKNWKLALDEIQDVRSALNVLEHHLLTMETAP